MGAAPVIVRGIPDGLLQEAAELLAKAKKEAAELLEKARKEAKELVDKAREKLSTKGDAE